MLLCTIHIGAHFLGMARLPRDRKFDIHFITTGSQNGVAIEPFDKFTDLLEVALGIARIIPIFPFLPFPASWL